MAARPLRGRAVALPWPTATDGPSSGSVAALACPAVPPPATRSSPAGARGAVAHPGPRGGRPAAPCPLSQGAGLRGGALKFCSSPHPPDQSLGQPGGACRFGLGDEAAGAVALGLGIAGGDLGISRGELVRAHPPRASRHVPLEHRAYRQPPSVCPSALTRHAARCPRPQVLRLGAALPSGHGSPPSPPRGCRQSGRPDSRESGPCRGGLP